MSLTTKEPWRGERGPRSMLLGFAYLALALGAAVWFEREPVTSWSFGFVYWYIGMVASAVYAVCHNQAKRIRAIEEQLAKLQHQ